MRLFRISALMALMLCCAVMLLTIVSMRGLPAAPGGGQPAGAALGGDVNCDGTLDITDPIYLLRYLFLDGPTPCAVAQDATCCETVAGKLDELRQAVESLQPSFRSRESRLVDNEDGTVTDSWTGLMWQKNYLNVDVNLDGSPDSRFNLNRAKLVTQQSRVAGYDDWRLPTFEEFETLMRFIADKPFKPSDIPPFELHFGDQGIYYWTSTATGEGAFAANVHPGMLEIRGQPFDLSSRAWLVRKA